MSLVNANPATKIYVNPSSIIDVNLTPGTPQTIKPNGNGAYWAWTEKTFTIRPMTGTPTYTGWTGNILALNPNGHGTFSEWSSWVHLSPFGNGNYTDWTGSYTFWDDDPTQPHDGDSTTVWTTASNRNASSTLALASAPPRSLSISKVRLTIVARNQSGTGSVRLMLVFGTFGSSVRGYNGSLITPTTSYATYTSEWSTNPDTSSSWTWSDIDTLQAGVRSQGVTGTIYVTQLYVSVLTGGLYTDWDEWPTNNTDTDYIFTTASAKNQSSALLNHTTETWTIGKVKVFIIAKFVGTSATVQPIIVVGGTAYTTGTASSLTAGYTEISREWSTNPGWNNNPWNWTAIDALEAGVRSEAVTGEIRVTQMYVKVIEASGAGTYVNWDEADPNNGDTDFLSAMSTGLTQTSQLEDSSETWTPWKVQVMIVARADTSQASAEMEKVQLMVRVGTTPTDYFSSSYTLSTSYKTYQYAWSNVAWITWANINSMQAGVKSVLGGSSWKGEIRVTQLYVIVTDGQSYSATYKDCGNYTDWDDTTQNGDTDYVSATWGTPPMRESSELENIASPPTWTIASVRVVIYARATVVTDEQVRPILVISAYLYSADTAYTLTTTYAKYTADWPKNPKTGVAWTWSDINAANFQAGVQSEISDDGVWTGELRVTQLYVEIVGPRVTVDIRVDDVTDLAGYNFFLNYSTTVLTATGVTLISTVIAGDTDIGPALVTFASNEKHRENIAPNGIYDNPGEYIYRDADGSGKVSAGDVRLTAVGSYAAGSTVGASDTDVGQSLVAFKNASPTYEKHRENVAVNSAYDPGEYIYLDADTPPSGTVSAGDVRLTAVGSYPTGSFFPYSAWEVKKVINDAQGYVWYAVAMPFGSQVGVNGSGILATIYFSVDSSGESTLDLDINELRNSANVQIAWILGDVDGDRTVDASDLSILSNAYASESGDSNWNSKCDFNNDVKVDVYDLFDQGKNYSKTNSYDGYFRNTP